jgi:hypothetical protein
MAINEVQLKERILRRVIQYYSENSKKRPAKVLPENCGISDDHVYLYNLKGKKVFSAAYEIVPDSQSRSGKRVKIYMPI